MTTRGTDTRRGSPLALLGFIAALMMTSWAMVLDVATFATNDYTPILIRALAWAGGSFLLLVICWRKMPLVGRVIAVCLLLMDIWVFWDAGGRRLLGW